MMWKEEDHPRDDDGKFTDGNGTGAKSGSIRPGESGKREDDFGVDLSTTNPEDFIILTEERT